MVPERQRTHGSVALECASQRVSSSTYAQAPHQGGDVRLTLGSKVTGAPQISPHPITTVAIPLGIQRLCGNDQLRCHHIGTIAPPCERPQTFADVDVVQAWSRLVQVVSRTKVQVPRIVVAAPVIEERHNAVLERKEGVPENPPVISLPVAMRESNTPACSCPPEGRDSHTARSPLCA